MAQIQHTPLDKSRQITSLTLMTNRLAIIIALLIIGFFVLDHYVLGLNVGLFLTRKGLALLSWIAFWR